MDQQVKATGEKKILENTFLAGLVVPTAIVLVSALIIFGITKMLNTERTHRDLVQELHSKTFGNRWVAAYELSKLLAIKRIPQEELPWLVENLSVIYNESIDARTRNFIILALGSLRNQSVISIIEKALKDPDPQVQFSAAVSLGNMPPDVLFDVEQIMSLLNSEDNGLKQVGILTVATRRYEPARELLKNLLIEPNQHIRFAAATGLINFKDQAANSVLLEIAELKEGNNTLDPEQIYNNQMNVINGIRRERWVDAQNILLKLSDSTNAKVSVSAQEVLNLLKK